MENSGSRGKKTLILGASPNPSRVSFQAAEQLARSGVDTVAVGIREGFAGPIRIEAPGDPLEDIHTLTLYLNPTRQQQYYEYILATKPQRIIFNPGTENPVLMQKAREAGIEVDIACTLVMLSLNSY
jgi:predicted CoA-binding protein